jgi:hypothetical protein
MDDEFHAIAQSIADSGSVVAIPVVPQKAATLAPSPGLRYSPALMVDLIVNNPDYSPKQLGEDLRQAPVMGGSGTRIGQFPVCPRPTPVRGAQSRICDDSRRALPWADYSLLTVLQEKLEAGKALPDLTVVKIAELGIKALGMGQKVAEKATPDEAPKNSSEMVADRIMAAMAKRKAAEQGDAVDVIAVEVPNE